MKKDKMRLKGQLGMYMKWPLIMTLLLFAMNIWMYMIDKKAGVMMTVFIAIYLIIASSLYFHNRSLILADLIQFSVQYKGIENWHFLMRSLLKMAGSCGRMIALKS